MSEYGQESPGTKLATNIVTIALLLGASAGIGKYVEHGYGPDEAKQYLDQNGYKNEHLIDTDTFAVGFAGCDQLDAVKHEFLATAPNDTKVKVMVCNGLFKGATIRQGGV